MASNTTYISDLNFDTHNWSIRVTVLHKYPAAYGRESNSLYQKILLTDDNGTLVEAMIYGTVVNYFTPILQEGRKYIVTNAQLRAQQGNRISSLSTVPFYSVLYTSTPVEPIDGYSTDIHAYNPQFATMAKLSASRDTNQQINYVGIVVGRRPPRSVGTNYATIQEYYVIDQQRSSHMTEIDALINFGDLYRVIHTPPGADNDVHATIANILEAGRSPSAPMLVKARLDDDFQNHQCICCSEYNRSTRAASGSTFYCGHCSCSRTAIVRFKLNVVFYDNTKEIPITVFGSDAEHLIGYPPNPSIQTIQTLAPALRAKFRTHSIRATINLRSFNNRPSYTVSQCPYVPLPPTHNNGQAPSTLIEAIAPKKAQSSSSAEGTSSATNVIEDVQHSRIAGFPTHIEYPSTPPTENVDEHKIIEHLSSDNGPPVTPTKRPRNTPS